MKKYAERLKKIRASLEILEAIPQQLEELIFGSGSEGGLFTRVDVEQECRKLLSKAQEIDILDDLRRYIEEVTNSAIEEIKKKVTRRRDYLQSLFDLLEDPTVNEQAKTLLSYDIGGISKRGGYRWALENELSDYMNATPRVEQTVLRKAKAWISGEYPPIVKRTGYRVIDYYICIYRTEDKDKRKHAADVRKRVTRYQDIFFRGIEPDNPLIVRIFCLSSLADTIALEGNVHSKMRAHDVIHGISQDKGDSLAEECAKYLTLPQFQQVPN